MGKLTAAIRVADEVWIGAALLHREHEAAVDFSVSDIKARILRERLTEQPRPGIDVHLSRHCVASYAPNGGRYRMLVETAPGRRRLFRPGDPYHPDREGGKITPDAADLPPKYQPLLEWYREWAPSVTASDDPLLALAKRHRAIWKGTDADNYVRRLREGFE